MNQEVTLTQRKLWIRKVHILKPDGLQTHTQDLEIDSTIFIPFSDIDSRKKTRIYSRKKVEIFYAGALLVLFGLVIFATELYKGFEHAFRAGLPVVILGLLVFGFYILNQIKYFLVPMDNGQMIYFLYNNPSAERLKAFINALYEARKLKYREIYFKIDLENDKQKELSRMSWLLSEQIISQDEYEEIVEQIHIKFL